MSTVDQWFSEYAESHQHPTNKLIHWICVPLIFWSILALLYSIPVPLWISESVHGFNWSYIVVFAAYIYYLRLSIPLSLGIAIFVIACYLIIFSLEKTGLSISVIAFSVFVLAWIGQFIGHKIEGKKPSFFKDLQFLLIGPLWLLHFIYKKLNVSYI